MVPVVAGVVLAVGTPAAGVVGALYGTDEWRKLWDQRFHGYGLTPDGFREWMLDLYGSQLAALGYTHVLRRKIRTRGRLGKPLYDLFFASTHPAGGRIMEHCFEKFYEAKDRRMVQSLWDDLDGES